MRHKFPSSLAIVGMGYVGLPLATAYGRLLPTIGFDIDSSRVQELKKGYDRNGEATADALKAPCLSFSHDAKDLQQADLLIVAVPTPLDSSKRPDLSQLVEASRLIGQALRSRQSSSAAGHAPIIVYESTVYPGCTEQVCIPVLEQESGLRAGSDFKVGYSPERINPGDPEHTLDKVIKVVAAQDPETMEAIAEVYGMVAKAGVYKAPDIPTAEAAKVIENVQRDLNIALVNELAMLFHRLGLDTREVLKAAGTKWNFLPFQPGLVGGHCIPVDPYYITFMAQEAGYYPEIILAGRRINDGMGMYVAQETVKLLTQAGKDAKASRVLVLGATFKEDVRDIRNTRVVDLVRELESYGADVGVHDPMVDKEQLRSLGFRPVLDPFSQGQDASPNVYDAVVLAVPHRAFQDMSQEAYMALLRNESGPGVLVDVKGVLPWGRKVTSGVLYTTL